MRLLRGRSGLWTALAAACMFVLQSAVGGYALGTGPGGQQLDAFGNPLCIAGHLADTSHGNDRSNLLNCCTLACNSMAAAAVAPGDQWSVVVRQIPTLHVRPSNYQEPASHTGDHDPGRPRAPPTQI